MLQARLDVVDTAKSFAGTLDTRMYQELEPLHLPSKLRDRINKAQRRAAAEKDGVSLFTANVSSASGQADERDATRTSPRSRKIEGDSNAGGAKGPQRHRESSVLVVTGESSTTGTMVNKEKLHLPDVILGHKMREFEAKMNLNALFVDPLENNLHHLNIDDKEKVMLRMQEKIQGITAQIDAHFVQIKQELDANGIFDSAANSQRAQALCLVELQKRCKLEKLRDEAMKEVLDENGGTSQAAMSLMEGKLNDLLAQKHRDSRTQIDTSAQLAFSHLQKSTKSFALKRRPAVEKRYLSPVKQKQQTQFKHSNQLGHDNDAVDAGRQEPITDSSVTTSAGNALAPAEDWTSRHPHVALVLQVLSTSEGPAMRPPSSDSLDSFSSRGGLADESIADTNSQAGNRFVLLAEEWSERSSSYQIIADRAFQELLQRWARWRWDSTLHFHPKSDKPSGSAGIVLSDVLHRRLQRDTVSARLREDEERQRNQLREQTNAEKCKRASFLYQELQEGIQVRRHERDRRLQAASKRVSTPISKASTPGASLGEGTIQLIHPMVAIDGESRSRPATVASNTGKSAQLSGRIRDQRHDTHIDHGNPVEDRESASAQQSLVMSASAPLIGVHRRQANGRQTVRILEPAIRRDSATTPEQGSPRGDSRGFVRDRKLPMLSQLSRRSRTRGDSLIGAPTSMDLSTLGHFSNARMEERRSSAQTWAWHHPQTRVSIASHMLPDGERLSDQDEENDEDSDVDASERRDAMGESPSDDEITKNDNACCESELESNEDRESDDDTRSIRSSVSSRHLLDSARSSFSVVSKKGNQLCQLGDDVQGTRRRSKGKAVKSPKRGGPHRKHSTNPSKRASATLRGPRGSRLLSRPSNSSNVSGSSGGMFAGVQFTANAQILQHRLEELWNALEFPFSAKLIMLEKYANLEDPDAFSTALTHWETAVEIVLLREKLKHILSEYEELDDVKVSSRLTPSDWSYLLMQQVEIPQNAINLSPTALVEWTRMHVDGVTQKCEKMAQQLKANTGDDLIFQGHRYPPRL